MPHRPALLIASLLLVSAAGCDATRLTEAADANGFRVTIDCPSGDCSWKCYNEPLYVLDGIPIEENDDEAPHASLKPEDIASIEVLKAEAATAAYGSRGANGVVLITTKQRR